MSNSKQNLVIAALLLIAALQAFGIYHGQRVGLGVAQTDYVDVYGSGVTNATTTINTTSTQIFASVTKLATLVNNTTSTFSCFMDAANSLVASSSVVAGAGITLSPGATGVANSSTLPSQATFGRCNVGSYNCYPFVGALDCVATAKTAGVPIITK